MDNIDLKDLEKRCIQEEAPFCTARCPIHVDVRAFLKEAASGAWDEALRVLAATMPLPGIVARICDHPCQLVCKRAEAGGAIEVAEIERTAARKGRLVKRRAPLPRKRWRVAVVGSSLSSLAAAGDLAYKGHPVTFFQAGEPGAALWGIPEERLPRDVVKEEMDVLEALGVETRPGIGGEAAHADMTNGRKWLESVLHDFDAVYVGLDRGGLLDRGALPDGRLTIDPSTLAASTEGLFVGGEGGKGGFSPIESIAEGRRAAVSIDRFLQKVSLVAGREKEGPYETGLFTSLEHVAPRPARPVKDPSGYDEAEAIDEAKRCLQCECMECVKVCRYLEKFESYPKRYVRQVAADATVLMGSHGTTGRLVNSCSLCGLCAVVCPHDLSMADVCMEGRRSLVARGKMPPSAHWFALEDMISSNSEKAALALHEPGKDRSRFVFFPGCQMAATYPEYVSSTYALLRSNLQEVGLMLRCCGAPAKWAARDDLFAEAQRDLEKAWEGLGSPAIIAACPTCYRTLKESLPRAKTATLWETLSGIGTHGAGAPSKRRAAGASKRPAAASKQPKLAVHDPCASRHEPGMRDAVRKIVMEGGYDLEELALGGEDTECCGFGGLMSAANPALAADVAETRASRSPADYVTYCAACRNALARSGKRVIHVLDLLFPGDADPADRRVPGLSERRENRCRLKQGLLKELWKKRGTRMEGYERIAVRIPPRVRKLMEERRILTEDVKKVIDHAEKAGASFFNPGTRRRRASFRPAHVTYWVEYSPEDKGFVVHNAYSHRMEIAEEVP